MKNRRRFLCLLVIVLLLPVLTVFASEYTFVYDEAGILDQQQWLELTEMAEDTSVRYGCGLYIVTVWDYSEYGGSVRGAAENIFLANDFGLGSDDNGVLLLLSMAERDYALIAHGEIGNSAFTDYGKDVLSEEFLDDFRYDSWADGFEDYLLTSEAFLSAAEAGSPVDVAMGSVGAGAPPVWIMVLLIPALIAGVSCGIMAASMKTARKKTNVNDYRQQAQLLGHRDQFITRTVVRQKIESSTSSSGGTRVNSGGFSGKSGKF